MDPILLVICIGVVGAVIVWAFYKLFRKTDEDIGGAIEGEDVALLATGIQDPMLGVAAYTAGTALDGDTGGGDDDTQVDLTPIVEAAAVVTATNEAVATPEPSVPITEKVWSHETPTPEPTPPVSESVWSHHIDSGSSSHGSNHDYSSSSSSDSGSCGSSDCGSCGGGD